MRQLVTLTAAVALVLAFGFAGTAKADPWGDSVTSSAAVSGTLTNVVGAPDQVFIQIPDTVSVTVEFTDNVANPDGTGAADLSIDTFDLDFPGAATIEVSDDGTNFVPLTPPPLNDPARLCAGPGAGGSFCNYDDLAAGFITFDLDATGLAFVTHVRLTDLVEDIDDDPNAGAGFDLDAVVALTNFDLGTVHIQKNNLGATTIKIQEKGAASNGQQSFFFKITLTNPNSEDLTDIVFEDVLPAEFDLDGDAEDADNQVAGTTLNGETCAATCTASEEEDFSNDGLINNDCTGSGDGTCDGTPNSECTDGLCDGIQNDLVCEDGVCDGVAVTAEQNGAKCTATGAEHTNQGKSNKPFKLQPDIVTITADPGDGDVLVGDDVCEITVWAETDQKATGPKKVNFTPTECNEGSFIFLNEGVEVIDTSGPEDVTLLIDDDRIELVCMAATF